MNDERQFLPIQLPKGNVIILRKTAIFKVVPLDQHLEHDKIMDPYDILGVPRGVSDEDLTHFYHQVVKENHPDKVQSAGLSPQIFGYGHLTVNGGAKRDHLGGVRRDRLAAAGLSP